MLREGIVVERNVRPDFLTNPETGYPLELDFYIPSLKIGIEVQGQHHYTDPRQVHRDEVKRALMDSAGQYLIELSICQLAPGLISKKIYGGLMEHGLPLYHLNPFSTSWLEFDKNRVRPYRNGIIATYGRSEATMPPHGVRSKAAKELACSLIADLSIVLFKNRGNWCRGRLLRRQNKRSFVVRPFGTSKELFIRRQDIRPI